MGFALGILIGDFDLGFGLWIGDWDCRLQIGIGDVEFHKIHFNSTKNTLAIFTFVHDNLAS